MAEKSTRSQNWGRKFNFLPFVECNIKREGEEGSGVSHRLGFEDEETVSEGDEVENRWQKKEFPSIDARSAGAEKWMDYGNIHLRMVEFHIGEFHKVTSSIEIVLHTFEEGWGGQKS